MPSMMRRMRTRLPTYLSTGFGALVDISNSPWHLRPGMRQDENEFCRGANKVKSCSEKEVVDLSNELTGPDGGRRMRIARPGCQQVDLAPTYFIPIQPQ